MSRHQAVMAASDNVVKAALRVISADHYARESDPHADAEAEHAAELLALAARELARATDALPENEQPIGWRTAQDYQSSAEEPSREGLAAEVERLRAMLTDREAGIQKLIALENAGVDNWAGYSDALAMLED